MRKPIQHPAIGPGWDVFNNLSGTIEIELTEDKQSLGNTWMVRASETAHIKNISWDPQVCQRKNKEWFFRPLTDEERSLVAFKEPTIRVYTYENRELVEHRAPNGKFFTVDDMMAMVQRHELQTRGGSEWFGGIDCHHIYFEGLHPKEDGTWEMYWGS